MLTSKPHPSSPSSGVCFHSWNPKEKEVLKRGPPAIQNNARRTQAQDFYASTIAAMDAENGKHAKAVQEVNYASNPAMAQKLIEVQKAAEAEPMIMYRPKSPLIPDGPVPEADASAFEPGGKSVAGRKKMKGGEKWDVATGKEAAMVVDKEGGSKEPPKEETQEEHDIEVELTSILKRGPSKSFSSPS